MTEYVLWAVLHFHRGFDGVQRQQAERRWEMPAQRRAVETRVGVLGLGQLGVHVARQLLAQGSSVSGWSRSLHEIPGVHCHSGMQELGAFLSESDVVVCLLPLTAETQGLLGADFFARMKPGAALIHCGRGEHLVAQDLLGAINEGHLRGAVLDVFETEPLPASDPLWAHEQVWVTPHMASSAHPSVMAGQILENLARSMRGESLLRTVDRSRGY